MMFGVVPAVVVAAEVVPGAAPVVAGSLVAAKGMPPSVSLVAQVGAVVVAVATAIVV